MHLFQWTDMLNIIAQALEENEISFKTLFSGSKFQVFYFDATILIKGFLFINK